MAEAQSFWSRSYLLIGIVWLLLAVICGGFVVELWLDAADGEIVTRGR